MKAKLAIAGVAVAALALAGCSSSDDDEAEATPSPTAEESEELGTIAEVASGADDFSTLVAAATAAGLVETLNGPGPFTVFAPNNAAFEALPEGVVDQLLLESNVDALTSILTYHVLADEVTSDEIESGDATTVNGAAVTITVEEDGGVMVNEANVIAPDVMASNGVIHAIDAVLLPPDFDPATLATE